MKEERALFDGLGAALAASPDLWSRLSALGFVTIPKQETLDPRINSAGFVPIGPFMPARPGEWVIDPASQLGWEINREGLTAHRKGRRIALIGESAAAAFGYAPRWTLARAIACCYPGLDVIDLARPGLEIADLIRIADALSQIELDAVVIFAGNNWWQAPALHAGDRLGQWVSRAMEVGGWRQWQASFVMEGRRLAAATAEHLVSILRVPTLIVVPQSNLLGWTHAWWTPMWLPQQRRREWLTRAQEAEAALVVDDQRAAIAAAKALLTLDDGASPRALQIAALCASKLGQETAARTVGELARDALGPWLTHAPPQVPSWARAALLDAPAADILDLTTLLDEDGSAPVAQAFLDYCHLSAEVLARLAGAIAVRLGAHPSCSSGLPDELAQAEAEALAAAHTHALGGNATMLLAKENVRMHYGKVAAAIACPSVLRGISDMPSVWDHYLATFEPMQSFCALAHAAAEDRRAIPVTRTSISLEACMLPDSRSGGTAGLGGLRRAHLPVCGPVARFFIPWSGPGRLTFDVQAPGGVTIQLNGAHVSMLPPRTGWSTAVIDVEAEARQCELTCVFGDGAGDVFPRHIRRGWQGEAYSLAFEWARLGPLIRLEPRG